MNETEPSFGSKTHIELAHEAEFVLGHLHVRPASREIIVAGEAQILQPRVMQVLVALARRRGEVVSRDDLAASCWDGLSVSEDAIHRRPLVCPQCEHTMRIIAVIDDEAVIHRLLKHLRPWDPLPDHPARGPSWPDGETIPLTCHPVPDSA